MHRDTLFLDEKLVCFGSGISREFLLFELHLLHLDLKFLHLHLQHWVLRLLLCLSLLSFCLVTLEKSGGCFCCKLSDFCCHLGLHRLVLLFRRHRQAKLLFDLFAILKRHVLVDVRHHRRLHLLSHRVLTHDLHNLRILHSCLVHSNVSLMILLDKRLDRFASQNILVLLHRVGRGLIVLNRYQLVSVLDAKHLNHLTMQQR